MDDQAEIDETPRKITGRKPEGEIKQAAMVILEQNGFGHGAIAKALDYHPKSVSRALPELRKESLRSPRKLKLASKCTEKVMQDYINERPGVKGSDAVRVSELVYKAAGELDKDNGSGAGSTQLFFQVNQQYFAAPAPAIPQDVVLQGEIDADNPRK